MKKQQVLLVVLFCVLVFAMPMLFLVNRHIVLDAKYADHSFEKRTPAPLPDVRQTGIRFFPDAMEEYFRDHLPQRYAIIQLNADINKELFCATTSTKVHLGKDGWLFFKDYDDVTNIADYQGVLPLKEGMAQQVTQYLEQITAEQNRCGREVVLLIPPNKEAVYGSRYLPNGIPQLSPVSRSDRLMAEIQQAAPGLHIANPKPLLLQYAQTDNRLYYKTDTHWTTCGAYLGAVSILQELGIPVAPYEELTFYEEGVMSGDLGSLSGLQMPDDPAYQYDKQQGITVQEVQQGGLTCYTSNAADPRRVLVLGDSFRDGLQPVLPYLFAEVGFASFTDNSFELIEHYDPDVIVFEQVERNLELFETTLPAYILYSE